jgi:crotonobetainyl-CoA:carnitine CoA-transferase CaiB-like acyl-CoA transferase
MEGVRVVELGVWVAGPAAGGILADWGADVVKIEPPTGDPARGFLKMMGGDLPFNPPFELDNRGKRSIVVDLQTEAGLEVALALLATADVFVTNVRLAGLARLGLDYAALAERFPRLVYGAMTGYGLDGPEKDRAAYDIGAFWARAGIVHLLTQPGGEPPFQRGGMGDHSAGMTAAGAISAALYSRERTGRGQLVSTSYTIGFDVNTALRLGVTIAVGTRPTMTNVVINSYVDSDGRWFWLIGLDGERHWPDLCRAVGRVEWLEDERFARPRDRRVHTAELVGLLDEIFGTRTRAEWGEIFDRENVWWAPVQNLDEVLVDPQVAASGAFVEVPDGGSTATMVATPADFSGTPWSVRSMPPHQGEHTDEILAELGLDPGAVAALRERGAVS